MALTATVEGLKPSTKRIERRPGRGIAIGFERRPRERRPTTAGAPHSSLANGVVAVLITIVAADETTPFAAVAAVFFPNRSKRGDACASC